MSLGDVVTEQDIKQEITNELSSYDRVLVSKTIEYLMRDNKINRNYSYSGWWVIYKKKALELVSMDLRNNKYT